MPPGQHANLRCCPHMESTHRSSGRAARRGGAKRCRAPHPGHSAARGCLLSWEVGAVCGFRRWLATVECTPRRQDGAQPHALPVQRSGGATALHLTPSSQQNAQVSLPAHATPAGLQHSPSASSVPKASASPMPQSMPSPLSTMLRRASYTCIYKIKTYRTNRAAEKDVRQQRREVRRDRIDTMQGAVQLTECRAVKHPALTKP